MKAGGDVRHRPLAIPKRLPNAKTIDRNRITPGETIPTSLSFLNVFKENGKVKAMMVHQKNRAKIIALGINNARGKMGKENAIKMVWIFITDGV